MARYLVGMSKNAWNFNDAYNDASPGDILEFEYDCAFNMRPGDIFQIEKDITIRGTYENNENGGVTLCSYIKGSVLVKNGANVTLEYMNIIVDADVYAVGATDGGVLTVKNCVVGNNSEENQRYLVQTKNAEINLDGILLRNVGDRITGVKLEETKAVINNAQFNSLFINNKSDVKLSNSQLITPEDRAVISVDSKLDITNSYIKNYGKKDTLYLKNSEVKIENSEVYSGNDEDKIEVATNCDERSNVKIINTTMAALKVNRSVAITENIRVEKSIVVSHMSFLCAKENTQVGFDASNVNIDVYSDSVARFENLIIDAGWPVHMVAESYIRIENLDWKKGAGRSVDVLPIGENGIVEVLNNGGKVTQETRGNNIQRQNLPARAELDNLIGLRKVKEQIDRMLNTVDYNNKRIERGLSPQKQSLHSVFIGNPGTGKTTVARLIGEILQEKGVIKEKKVVEVSRTDLVGSYKGHTGPKTRAILEKAIGGVLFIDEAYSLVNADQDSFGEEAVDEILKFMEDNRDNIVIIFAGYTKEMEEFLRVNPGLKSRVPNVFDFEDYTPDEIVLMGEKILEKDEHTLEDKGYYERYVKRAYSASLDKSNGRWIRNLNEKIVGALAQRVIENNEEDITTIKNVDIDSVINSGKYVDDGRKKDAYEELNKLIGIAKVKEQVEQFVAQANINKLREEQGRASNPFSLHSLFLGNPGTGKTTVARILGELLYQKDIIAQNKFIEVSRSDLVAGNVGHTAIKTRKVLESALGGVLFIDEAYSLSTGGDNDFGREAIDEILKFMEDYRGDIVIIFAGYNKEMAEFLNMNSGLRSRVLNNFDFEDYTVEEITQIGLLGLSRSEYIVDKEEYAEVVKELYKKTNDNSNGRWIRNVNEKLIMYMSTRIARTNDSNYDEITHEDLVMLLGKDTMPQKDALSELRKLIGIEKVKGQVEEFIALAEVNKLRSA